MMYAPIVSVRVRVSARVRVSVSGSMQMHGYDGGQSLSQSRLVVSSNITCSSVSSAAPSRRRAATSGDVWRPALLYHIKE